MATDLERLVVQLSADFKAFERGLARAQGISNRQFNAIERRASQLDARLNAIGRSAVQGLVAPLTGLGTALGVREIARYADAWTEAGNKIRSAAASAGVNVRSLDLLKEGANEARTALTDYVDLYARLIRSASGVAKSEQEIADATSIVAKAFKAGGASAQEQAAGILQLGQALGSGVLQGDELRSLRENAPILAQAIADEFGVTIAQLKKLGEEGELTSERVFRAILNAQKNVEKQFKATNATISDALTRLDTEFTAYIGNADASAGASRALIEALQFLAENFKGTADVVVQFAAVLIGALTGRALLGMVGGLGNAVVALGSFLTALRTGTVAAAGFTAALGPIGLLAGAAAAAIFLLYQRQGQAEGSASTFNRSLADNETALRNATSATYAQVDALRQLIAAQAQAARAAATQAAADFEIAIGRRTAFRKATGFEFAPLVAAAEQADREAVKLEDAALLLEEQLKRADELLKTKVSGFGGGGGGAGSGSSAGGARNERENEFERLVERIREGTAAVQAETEAQRQLNPLVDDYGFAVEKARTAHDLLTAAKQADLAITPQLRAQIEVLSEQYARASAESARLADAQEEIRQKAEEALDTARDATRGFIDDLLDGASAGDAFANAMKKLGSALIDDFLNSVLQLKNLSGGGGGILGSLFGNLFGGGFSPTPGVGLWSDGGWTGPGGKYQPAGIVHKGEYVFDQASVRAAGGPGALEAMRRRLKGYANGGAVGMPALPKLPAASGAAPVTYAPSFVIDARGAEPGVEQKIRDVLREYDRGSFQRFAQNYQQGQKRGVVR